MYILFISEQTAIISLYSINWLVCITETECVYCAVRTGCLYIIRNNFSIVVLWVVPWFRRLVTGLSLRKPRFDARPVYVRFVVGHVAQGQALLPALQLYPARIIPPMFHPHLIYKLLRPGQVSEVWEPWKYKCSFGNGVAFDFVL